MSIFKEGDKVYYPLMSNKILTLQSHGENHIKIADAGSHIVFERNGKLLDTDMTQRLFHATKVNYELLTNLYPSIDFEDPLPTSAKIIKKMLDDGYAYVLCEVLTYDDITKDIIQRYDDYNFYGEYYRYNFDEVSPLDIYTGKTIVNYVVGKPILEGN